MDIIFLLLVLAAFAVFRLKSKDQGRRIALLGRHLSQHQIEKLMESLTDGYLRALGEKDAERQTQIWNLLATSEQALCEQFDRFVADFSKVDAADARVSKLAVAIPFADKLFPAATFDLRQALAIHAQGIHRAVNNEAQRSPKTRPSLCRLNCF